MFRPRLIRPANRRGIILLVVVSMLTLFAIIGITFVLYAQSEATASRGYREAEQPPRPDVDPQLLLSYFLHRLVWGAANDDYSVLRGHELMRLQYGRYPWTPPRSSSLEFNRRPHAGVGRLQWASGRNDWPRINYQDRSKATNNRGPRRDPESYPGGRVSWSVNYTYPDHNNMFLAAVQADGTVLVPSFRRPWTENPADWTTSLRPPTAEIGPMEDAGGDVKNLHWSPGYWDGRRYHTNDSIWLDLGFPVQKSPDGRKFKPLFAPLVIDLDGRVNISVSGNRHNNGTHASNQGWGRWEINVGRVMTRGGNEWQNLLTGNPSYRTQPRGRYGTNSQPANGGPPTDPARGRFYSLTDYDGGGGPLTIAPDGFPNFPAAWENCQNVTNHASLYNYRTPGGDDQEPFTWSNLEALLRYSDTGSPALTSDLFRLCPVNFADQRTRNLVTTHSYDWNRPSVTAFIWDADDPRLQPTLGNYNPANPDTWYPTAPPIPFQGRPNPNGRYANVPNTTEYDQANYDSNAGFNSGGNPFQTTGRKLIRNGFQRLDLNVKLPPYPAPQGPSGQIQDYRGYRAAHAARESLAKGIFDRLVRVTGLDSQNPLGGPQWDAKRWMAQLAVNIVDFIDDDDYVTAFQWTGGEYVYGTELPRLVINEVYAQVDNLPAGNGPGQDPGLAGGNKQATKLRANVWVELHNPLRNPDPRDPNSQNTAQLQTPAFGQAAPIGCYRLLLTKPNTNLRRNNNTDGKPDNMSIASTGGVIWDSEDGVPDPNNAGRMRPVRIACVVDRFHPKGATDKAVAEVVGPSQYALVGPSGATLPTVQNANWQRPELRYDFNAVQWNQVNTPAYQPTVLLQRLVCPYLPPNYPGMDQEILYTPQQPVPAQAPGANYPHQGPDANGRVSARYPNEHFYERPPAYDPNKPYNPYITVDYVTNVHLNTVGQFDSQGNPAPKRNPQSSAKRQPYASHSSQVQVGAPTLLADNGLGRRDWLVHLDRQLVSMMEILNVSTFKPHELTQQFVLNGKAQQHRDFWDDQQRLQASRVYRVLEFLECHDRAAGSLAVWPVSDIRNIAKKNPTQPTNFDYIVLPTLMQGVGPTNLNRPPWNIPWNVNPIWNIPWYLRPGELITIMDPNNPATAETTQITRMVNNAAFECQLYKPHGPGEVIYIHHLDERVAGRINLNTVWDEEVFQALCDSNAWPVSQIYQAMIRSRTPGGTVQRPRPGPNDRPFRGMGFGNYPPGDPQFPNYNGGLDGTWLRLGGVGGGRLFDLPGQTHPFLKNQLLTKIYGNITCRSNVFAAWVTVGFFEVVDDSTMPPVLGKEIGRTEGRHIRHRMFALIDRSFEATTENPGTATETQNSATAVVIPPGGGAVTTTIDMIRPLQNANVGATIEIWETVMVPQKPPNPPVPQVTNYEQTTIMALTQGATQQITARFSRPHSAGSFVRVRWSTLPPPRHNTQGASGRLNPTSYPGTIPFYSVIE